MWIGVEHTTGNRYRQIHPKLFEQFWKTCGFLSVVGAVTQFQEKCIPQRIPYDGDKVFVSFENGWALACILLQTPQCGGVIPGERKVFSYGLRCAEDIFVLVRIHHLRLG